MGEKKGLSNKQKGYIGLAAMLLLAAFTIWGTEPLYKAISGIGRPKSDVPIYHEGTYEATARGYGGEVKVKITVSDREIRDVKIEGKEETPDIGGKAVDQLPNIIYSKQSEEFDAVSGATITSNAVKLALKEAMISAAREGTSLADLGNEARELERSQEGMPALEDLLAKTPDGDYEYTDSDFDESGYKNAIHLTVEKGRVKALTWDCVNQDGKGKRQLSLEGNYDMTETGLKWYQQADQLQAYVMENQSVEGLADDSGYCDAIASVSINIAGFIHSVKMALTGQ